MFLAIHVDQSRNRAGIGSNAAASEAMAEEFDPWIKVAEFVMVALEDRIFEAAPPSGRRPEPRARSAGAPVTPLAATSGRTYSLGR